VLVLVLVLIMVKNGPSSPETGNNQAAAATSLR